LLAAVKRYTLLDLRGNIPTFIHIAGSQLHEVTVAVRRREACN
jgi:hypothetical protein